MIPNLWEKYYKIIFKLEMILLNLSLLNEKK